MIMEIQIGLYQEIIYGKSVTYSKLYSKKGYRFYDKEAKVYDEEGKTIPEEKVTSEQREYLELCYTPLTDVDAINARFVSMPENLI